MRHPEGPGRRRIGRYPREPVALLAAGAAVLAAMGFTGCAGTAAPPTATVGTGTTVPVTGASQVGTTSSPPVDVTFTERKVDVSGRSRAIRCAGSGSPVVVFVGDIGQDGDQAWGNSTVPASVAQRTTACVYDRAGLGNSANGPLPRSVKAQADDLAGLLGAAGVDQP